MILYPSCFTILPLNTCRESPFLLAVVVLVVIVGCPFFRPRGKTAAVVSVISLKNEPLDNSCTNTLKIFVRQYPKNTSKQFVVVVF